MISSSVISIPKDSHFSLHNLPYGAFIDLKNKENGVRIGVAIGDDILNLSFLEKNKIIHIPGEKDIFLNQTVLNRFMSMGKEAWDLVRTRITEFLREENSVINSDRFKEEGLIPMSCAQMTMPVAIGDYTDFYSSEVHATNIGKLFRDKDNPLLPNWRYVPIAYNGRASSIVLSGAKIHRPKGQLKLDENSPPIFSSAKKVDFELEMGLFVGDGNKLGSPIPIKTADNHIFGFVLVNDWSARDIQKWEYQPLGPFLSKIFATSISPWVVPAAALEPFKIKMPEQNPTPNEYLRQAERHIYDVNMEISIKTRNLQTPFNICKSNYKYLYWSTAQHIAHHTVTGCNLRTGDLMASGSISGPEKSMFGSLMELSWNGTNPIVLPNGEKRSFIEDHDQIIMTAWCQGDDYLVGFGELEGTILPALG